jgi:hypothetical protein
LDSVITAVSRLIDQYCGRRFYTTSSDETRYYTAVDAGLFLCPDDIVSLTMLATDGDGDRVYEDTWAATDYDLEPFNASLDSQPYVRIRVTPDGLYSFPTIRKSIKLVGKFGYASTTPAMIKEACLLQCERLFKRKDAPFGVLGAGGMGQAMVLSSKLDPDVELMLWPFVRAN